MPILQEHKSVKYKDVLMPISPKAPTFGAGAKIGNTISTNILLHASLTVPLTR